MGPGFESQRDHKVGKESGSESAAFAFHEIHVRPGGEIGRHVRLRGVWRKLCWFESSPGHHKVHMITSEMGKARLIC